MPRLTLILSVSVSSERFMYKCTVLHWGFILIWFTSSTASLSAVPSKLPQGAIWVDITQPLSLCSRMLMLLLPTTRTSDLFLDVVNVLSLIMYKHQHLKGPPTQCWRPKKKKKNSVCIICKTVYFHSVFLDKSCRPNHTASNASTLSTLSAKVFWPTPPNPVPPCHPTNAAKYCSQKLSSCYHHHHPPSSSSPLPPLSSSSSS